MCSKQAKHLRVQLGQLLPCTPGRTMLQPHVWCIEAFHLFTHSTLVSNSQMMVQLYLKKAWNQKNTST